VARSAAAGITAGAATKGKAIQSNEFARSFYGTLTSSSVRLALGGKIDITTVVADAFGNALGNSVIQKTTEIRTARNERKQRTEAAAPAAGYAANDGLEEIIVTAKYLDPIDVNPTPNLFVSPPSPDEQRGNGRYTVRRGDTLSRIAEEQLGDANLFMEIVKLNGISDPNRIEAGAQLLLPEVVSTDARREPGALRGRPTPSGSTTPTVSGGRASTADGDVAPTEFTSSGIARARPTEFEGLDFGDVDTTRVYISDGRSIESGEYAPSPFSRESLRQSADRNSNKVEAEFDVELFGDSNTTTQFDAALPQTTFGDEDFQLTVGPRLTVRTSTFYEGSAGEDGFVAKAGAGVIAEQTYYSGRAESGYGTIDLNVSSLAEAKGSVSTTLGYSRESGLSLDTHVSAAAGAAAIKGQIKGTTREFDLFGLLNVSAEGRGEGHLVGIGASGDFGVRTLKTRPGLRFVAGAGLTIGAGGKLGTTVQIAPGPRVVSTYRSMVRSVSDLMYRVFE
jgi:hypothetical protein